MNTTITIQTKKVEKPLTWYLDHKLSTGNLLQSAKGHLMRVVEYWPEGEAGATKTAYGILTVTTNKFQWIDEANILLGLEKGQMWEVEIVTN